MIRHGTSPIACSNDDDRSLGGDIPLERCLCDAPFGYDMHDLGVMAGPKRRWRFGNHPNHDSICRRDTKS